MPPSARGPAFPDRRTEERTGQATVARSQAENPEGAKRAAQAGFSAPCGEGRAVRACGLRSEGRPGLEAQRRGRTPRSGARAFGDEASLSGNPLRRASRIGVGHSASEPGPREGPQALEAGFHERASSRTEAAEPTASEDSADGGSQSGVPGGVRPSPSAVARAAAARARSPVRALFPGRTAGAAPRRLSGRKRGLQGRARQARPWIPRRRPAPC